MHRVYSSAIVGYEKPHAGFLGHVLDDGPWPEPIWVVGDSVEADCLPTTAYRCRAIPVRTLDERFRPHAADLGQAVDLITAQMPAREGLVSGQTPRDTPLATQTGEDNAMALDRTAHIDYS